MPLSGTMRLSDTARWQLHLLLRQRRQADLQLQSVLLPMHVRKHQRRLPHHLHQRRQRVLRNAGSLLRLPGMLLPERLLLLRLLRQQVRLLRHVRGLIRSLVWVSHKTQQKRAAQHSAVRSAFCFAQLPRSLDSILERRFPCIAPFAMFARRCYVDVPCDRHGNVDSGS